MALIFDNFFDATVTGNANSAAFQAAVTTVENFLSAQLTTFGANSDVTLRINWRFATTDFNNNPFGSNTLANNVFLNNVVTNYNDIRAALLARVDSNDANPGDDAAFTGALPAADPAVADAGNTVRWLVSRGQAKLLGLGGVAADAGNAQTDPDTGVTLNSAVTFDFDRSDGITANQVDAFGTIAHELTEVVMGRFMFGGADFLKTDGTPTNINNYSLMDLLHFLSAANGGPGRAIRETGANNIISFTGTQGDPNFNLVLDNNGDIADPSNIPSPRNSFADSASGVINAVTQTDLRIMDAIGWTRVHGLDDHNQSNTTATVLSPGVANGINGSLELQGDHDWFKVVLDGTKNYAVVVEGADTGAGTLADPFAALYSGATASRDTTTPVQTADNGGVGANSLLLTSSGAAGTFFVDVGSIGTAPESVAGKVQDIGQGTYRVSLIEDDFRQDTNTTGAVAVGGSSTGTVQFAKDHDWFEINLTTGENYAIIVKGNAGGLNDPKIQLRSPTGATLGLIHNSPTNDDADFGTGVTLNSRILWSRGIDDTLGPLPAIDGYFLDVFASNGTDLGGYTVSVIKDDFRGDQFGNNGSVTAGGPAVTGNIEFATDHDWFGIALTTGKNYAIIVQGNTLADPTISLVDPSGAALAQIHNSPANNDANFGSGLTLNSRILWSRGIDDTLASPGTQTYFLDVSSHIGDATGTYSVSVVEDDFRGDQFGNNGALTVGSLAGSAGKIEFQTDHDWFNVHLDAGTSYALRVRGSDSGHGTLPNPDLALMTAGGAAVVGGTLLHDITASNHDARLLIAPTATGDYFVDASSQVGADTGTYNVQALLASQLTKPNDFNGDGTSDILWRSSAGSDLIWEIQNFVHTATDPLPSQAPTWKVAETGDFDGDLTTDILWQSSKGQLQEWHIVNGAVSGAPIDLGFQSQNLSVLGTGDFYKDGRSAILFRSSNGEVLTWETNPDGTFKTTMDSHGFVSRSDHIVGTGDFNGDGRAEILWRGPGGELLKSDAVGATLTLNSLGSLSSAWHVVGTGDFFGDGKQEAVVSKAGEYKLADLNGGPLLGPTITIQPEKWKLADIGDFNGDDKYDLLFRTGSGEDKFVEANGTEHVIDPLGATWAVLHHNYEFV
jgi:hypothetical protein